MRYWIANPFLLPKSMNFHDAYLQTTLAFRGNDRQSFLHRLCTQDLRLLQDNPVLETFFTDVKGKSLAHGWVINQTDAILVTVHGQHQERLLTHFDRYLIREDVAIADESGQWIWYYGNRDLFARLEIEFRDLPKNSLQWGHIPSNLAAEFPSVLAWKESHTRCGWLGVASTDAPRLVSFLQERGGIISTENDHHNARIRDDWPQFGLDFDESHLPQEIDRDAKAISFTKGCYLGQETIARLDALGQVQKKLFRLQCKGQQNVAAGARVMVDSTEAGWITSSAIDSQENQTQMMAFIKRAFHSRSTRFTVEGIETTYASPTC